MRSKYGSKKFRERETEKKTETDTGRDTDRQTTRQRGKVTTTMDSFWNEKDWKAKENMEINDVSIGITHPTSVKYM